MEVDKRCVLQVLGSLMKHPQFLSEVDKYSFILSEFPTRLDRYIYTAIYGLYHDGARKIQPFDIESYLKVNVAASTLFQQKNGIEYIQDLIEIAEVENFPYYYNKFKKLNLLKELEKSGFDITEFYIEDVGDERALEVNRRFELLSLKDITDGYRKKILSLESKYEVQEEVETEKAAEGMEDLLDALQTQQDIGLPIQGHILNQVISGARKGTLTIRSGSSGVGKSRNAVADACYLAYPIRYNQATCKWEQQGSCEKVLYIMTEQQFSEIRKMILSYLTGIAENRFKYCAFSEREQEVINQAIALMKYYQDNLILIRIPNPTIELIKTMIRETCIEKDIEYVFYDYIFIGPAVLREFKGFNLRNDEVLLMMATALKDLAVELNVAMFSSTQVNAKIGENKDIRDEGTLAGGRATINKADNGMIITRPTAEELEFLEPLIEEHDLEVPNLVTDIFKVRSGEWTNVRLWSRIDLGTMRRKDLYLTDARMEPVSYEYDGIEMMPDWTDEEVMDIMQNIRSLNEGKLI